MHNCILIIFQIQKWLDRIERRQLPKYVGFTRDINKTPEDILNSVCAGNKQKAKELANFMTKKVSCVV